MSRIVLVSLVAVFVVACASAVTVDDNNVTTSRLIGPEGGTVALGGGGKVVIPPGALSAPEQIEITKLDFDIHDIAALPGRYEAAGAPFAFKPHGLMFAEPVTIEVPFTGTASNVHAMRLPNEDATTWQTIASSAQNGMLAISTMTFSVIVAARDSDSTVDGGIDSGTDGGGTSGTGGTSGAGGTGGSGGGPTTVCSGDATDDPNCINLDCPQVAPTTGPRAMKGACCFRQSNADRAKLAWSIGEVATIELRQNATRTFSQPNSLGNPVIQASLANTYDQDWSNTLVRIEGVPASGNGPVVVTVGPGRPNCDGTYSFFGDGAAPDHEGRTDPNRWSPTVTMGLWDWDTYEKLWLSDIPSELRWMPTAKNHGLFGFEQPSQALSFDFAIGGNSGDDVEPQSLNCVGGNLVGASMWDASLLQTTFMPISDLETSALDSLALSQNQCSFIALGFMQPELCAEVPRTDWIELPLGMCDTARCYIGDETHPRADCGGTTGNECCDPTGNDGTKPACNAFLIESNVVLAAAEITDTPHVDPTEPFTDCTL